MLPSRLHHRRRRIPPAAVVVALIAVSSCAVHLGVLSPPRVVSVAIAFAVVAPPSSPPRRRRGSCRLPSRSWVCLSAELPVGSGTSDEIVTDAFPSDLADTTVDGGNRKNTGISSDSDSTAGIDDASVFRFLSRLAVRMLVKSDLKRAECMDAATGWTSWADERSAASLQKVLNSITIGGDCTAIAGPTMTTGEDLELDEAKRAQVLEGRDEAQRWMRWMKMVPEPVVMELSGELREVMDEFVTEEQLQAIDSTRSDLISRAGLRLHLLPSGSTLPRPLRNPTGTMVYGKLIYGGVTRFRQLSGGRFGTPRRAGERTVIHGGTENGADEGWLQYGGPERNYEAVDMGPCALIELIILPTGLTLPPVISTDEDDSTEDVGGTTIDSVGWNSSVMFGVRPPSSGDGALAKAGKTSAAGDASEAGSELAGSERNEYLRGTLTTAVGGLRSQVDAIVRRVLDGRAVRAVAFDDDGDGGEELGSSDHASAMEAAELAALGLNPVRGLLLYGPPGCGKTALARELSKALHARPPKIVAAPELLDRWVGGSEKLVRYLFADAEEELKACGGDASKSALHVVVIDEIDAVFRRRTASKDSGEATRASAVNQILAKLDGVEQIPNILLIGMTNRRELLDEALLRPGRLEVQMEIPLPDQVGRREILQIHFEALRERGLLSQPLCKVIDGVGTSGALSDSDDTTSSGRRKLVPRALRYARTKLSLPRSRRMSDLAADGVTGGFSGADLAGLVRCAGSLALSRARQRGDGVDGLLITLEDVTDALEEVKQ